MFLIGAGPGDPELLTVRAARLLGTADAVLHDDLVAPEILRLASPFAMVENVGKRCGAKSITQAQINARMIEFARAGFRVARLKSGDPMLFGRAGEEIDALGAAGIECEIVPGVSAAFAAAAAAKIPLTDRRAASKVVFVAGHRAGARGIEIPAADEAGATVAVYMPSDGYGEIAASFRLAGWDGATPCVIVSRASSADEQVVYRTIGSLAETERLPAPAILIVGKAAAVRETRTAMEQVAQTTTSACGLNSPVI